MEEKELTEWIAGHQRQLQRSAYLLTGDAERAQDLVQEALVKLALRWSRVRGGSPLAYARTIIVHDNISWWRRRRPHEVAESPHEQAGATSADPVTGLVVRRALTRLTPRQRAVLVLRYFDDLTEADTAQLMGCSRSTVNDHVTRGLAALRAVLGTHTEPTSGRTA